MARVGLETGAPGTRAHDWLTLNVVEFTFYLGRWSEAHEILPPASRRRYGNQLFVWRMARAVLALGEGDLETARVELDAMDPTARESTEPQFVGAYGWMRAELERRSGNLDPARGAVDDALDQIEYCSDDVARIAGVAAMGVRVEADAATLARDRREQEAERVALKRAEEQVGRLRLTSEAGGPVERAELASGEAEYARAIGEDDAALWAAAAEAWGSLQRPYRRVYARWREAEALVGADDRGAAAAVASDALRSARELGSQWLAAELESLAARARLRLLGPAEDAGPVPERRRAVRAHPARAPGAGARRRRSDQPRDRPRAAHGREDGQRARVAHPGQAGRALAHRGGRGRGAPGARRHERRCISPRVQLTSRTVSLALAEEFGIARGARTEAEVVCVELAHEGTVGRGEAHPVYYRGETTESASAFLADAAARLGEDPFALEDVLARLSGDAAGRAALDAALHDWVGRRLGVPVWRLLGLSRRAPVTSFTLGIDTLEGTRDRARRAAGYRSLKVKVGGAEDLARLEAVRGESDAPLRVDANEGWTLEQARELVPALVELGVELIEQPFPAADLESFRALRELAPRPPLIVDEGCQDLGDVAAVAGYADGINVKLAKSGGLREAVRMVHAARALGLRVMIGCMVESQLGIAPAAQIASLADWVDLDGHLLLRDEPFRGLELEDGRVLPSARAGAGSGPAA